MNPIRRRPCADPGQKPVPGEWMTQKGIDSSRPVTEVSRAIKNKAHERSHHRFTGFIPAFPAQWFYGLFRALPGDQACLTPSSALLLADLTPASGRQNHTTSPSAPAPFVKGAAASTASRPTLVTCATPLSWDGTARISELICLGPKQKYFCKSG